MELQLQSLRAGESAGLIQVSDATFGRPFSESLVHQVVTAYLAGARAGTHAQKTRSQVRGGGAKPFKQKGSPCARRYHPQPAVAQGRQDFRRRTRRLLAESE